MANIRDYIHVDDLAPARLLAIRATNPGTQNVFNVGTGAGHSAMEIIEACEDVSGGEIPYEVVERRPGDATALVADPSRIINELGWKPHYTGIEEIIATAWKWHQKNPEGYQ